jgi:hypothetical protein
MGNREVAHLKAGGVVIQRGNVRTWVNRGSVPVPAVAAFILTDAKPVEVNGKELHTVFISVPRRQPAR